MEKITCNGIELEFDPMDIDVLEKYEEEIEKTKRKVDECVEDTELTEVAKLRKQCEAVEDFFDNMFGEGTAAEVFQGNMNILDHLTFYCNICARFGDTSNRIKDALSKYSPNRAQIRAIQKGEK